MATSSLARDISTPSKTSISGGARRLRLGVVAVLWLAAALKVDGLWRGAEALPLLGSGAAQVGLIEAEIVLGLWLLSGWQAVAGWRTALGFFTLMAAASLYLAATGQPSCGCLGAVQVDPGMSLVFDLATVAALALWRPRQAERVCRGMLGQVMFVLGGAAGLAGLVAGVLWMALDDPSSTLASWRGELVSVDGGLVDIGEGELGTWRTVMVPLTNHGPQTVRVVGGTSSCWCLATGDLPTALGAGESRGLQVWVRFATRAGKFSHRCVFQTDDRQQPEVVGWLVGRSLPESKQ